MTYHLAMQRNWCSCKAAKLPTTKTVGQLKLRTQTSSKSVPSCQGPGTLT